MKIALTVGHSILKNGSYTSASGVDCGGVNEYEYNKKMMKKLKGYLTAEGHDVTLYICPEKVFTAASQERSWKLSRLNAKNYDLIIEGHLNCYNESAHGTEVLYVSETGKKYAARIQNKIVSAGFFDREIKKRTNLYMLNSTKAPTVMTESFFCDSKSDYKIGKDANKIARLIAEGVCDKKLNTTAKAVEAVKETAKKVTKKAIYAKVATKSDPLRIRKAASKDAKIIGNIPKGTKVEVITKGNTWTKIKYKSVTGYSATQYLKF